MCPSERRDVAQELWRAVKPGAFSCRNGLPEMLGVPVDDDGTSGAGQRNVAWQARNRRW
jgi:hypothetical protein